MGVWGRTPPIIPPTLPPPPVGTGPWGLLSLHVLILLLLPLPSTTWLSTGPAANGEGPSPGSVSVGSSLQLQCPPCERIHCSPRRARRLKCKGGVTRGVCNCCPVCAKTENDKCGGELGYLGRCDRGLTCRPAPPPGQDLLLREQQEQQEQQQQQLEDFHQYSRQETSDDKHVVGVCLPVPRRLLDQGIVPGYCEPKCTPKYCKANRRAICAARDNAITKQECQGSCQHTSCSACRYIRDEPSCIKCSKDDFTCMKQFAKCVKKSYCTRQKYPCKEIGILDEGAKFRCHVPDCLTN